MHIGFTGTQNGMTEAQKLAVHGVLLTLWAASPVTPTFHHGDCIGADAEADEIVWQLGYLVEIHPPEDDRRRAFCTNASRIHEPKPFLDRNKDIVRESQLVVATPGEREEKLRSGTWSTVRYARRSHKRVIVIYPEGDISTAESFYNS